MSKHTAPKEEISLTQHIEDLRERMRMLQQDRKTNVELLESSKAENKDLIKKLREDNKEFRQRLTVLQKTTAHDEEFDEQKHMQSEVERLRKLYDDIKLKSNRHRKQVEDLRDTVSDLELDSQRPHMEDNEYTRTIRALENKLDKAMIKFNEAQSIRKTYEQIVRRLKEERVGFDNQLAAIERTVSAKRRDYDELMLLAGDATHARDVAQGELERIRGTYDDDRRKREKTLRERNQAIQLRKHMLERIKQREAMRTQLVGGERMEKSQSASSVLVSQKTLALEKTETRSKIDAFENAFRKIKEATGVSDVNEVIQKIVSQESTAEKLIALTKENQLKIEAMNQQRLELKTRVEELKYSGVGAGQRRKLIDEQEELLSTAQARLERARQAYERLSKALISLKAGVSHLQDKLESTREELGGRKVELTDDSVTAVLRECESNIVMIMRRLKAGDIELKRNKHVASAPATDQLALMATGAPASGVIAEDEDIVNMSMSRPFNQRVDISDDRDGIDAEGDIGLIDDRLGGGPGGDLEDDELTRDKVKRASTQILQAVERKRRQPKRKGAAGADNAKSISLDEDSAVQ